EGALVADEADPSVAPYSVREFVPTSRPGARLPHGWVRARGSRVSTLDLVGLDGLTLLAGPDGERWIAAAQAIGRRIRCWRIGGDVIDPEDWWSIHADMEPDGVLVVRPDQHVAYRARRGAADPHAALARAFELILGRAGQ